MRKTEALRTLDIILEELLSTREGTEIYLQCLLRAVKLTCTPKKYQQIANKHLSVLKEVLLKEYE